MKIKISLSAATTWVEPATADLELEYKYEYLLPSRNWAQRCRAIGAQYPLFDNFEDFVDKVQNSKIEIITRDSSIHNMTSLNSISVVRDLVSGYQFPRDIDRIIDGYTKGAKMPMPIIIRGSKGSWILSGNTRSNIAFIMKIHVRAIFIDAS